MQNDTFSSNLQSLWNRHHLLIGRGVLDNSPPFLSDGSIDMRTQAAIRIVFENLKEVAKREKFSIDLHPYTTVWCRDSDIVTADGFYLVPSWKEIEIMCQGDSYKQKMCALQRKTNCSLDSSHPDFKTWIHVKEDAKFIKPTVFPFRLSSLFFEGGNFIRAYDPQNNYILLSGCQNLYASFLLCKKTKFFQGQENAVNEILNILEHKEMLSEALLLENQNFLVQAGFIEYQNNLNLVKEAIAQIEFLKSEFTRELGVPIIWIPELLGFGGDQPGFHIDMYLTALPGGKVCVQSSKESLKIIDSIFEERLTKEQIRMFQEVMYPLEEIKREYRTFKRKFMEVPKMKDTLLEKKKNFQEEKQRQFSRLATLLPDHSMKSLQELFSLYSYRICALALQDKEANRLEKIEEVLRKNGLSPVPVAAHFSNAFNKYKLPERRAFLPSKGTTSVAKTSNHEIVYKPVINYSNAVVGKGELGSFAIIMGFKSKVDSILRSHFHQTLISLGLKNVYFVGKDENQKYWAGSHFLKMGGGLHCLTNEFVSNIMS